VDPAALIVPLDWKNLRIRSSASAGRDGQTTIERSSRSAGSREPHATFASAEHEMDHGDGQRSSRGSRDAGGREEAGSAIRLLYLRNGEPSRDALSTNVILASSNERGWRSPLVFEVHRMSDHEYGEHRTVGNQLMINLGRSVRLGWLEDGRRRESEFQNEQICI
jgi:hypothetical protein